MTTDEKIDDYLASIGATLLATYLHQTKRDAWECDAWSVQIKTTKHSEAVPFFTGLGLRAKPTPLQKRAAQRSVGLMLTDQKNRTRMYRRYLAHVETLRKPKAPEAASVLHSLLLDAQALEQSFYDWAGDLGFDTDSRKALATYEACCESGQTMRKLFTRQQRETLNKLLEDY